MKDFINFIERPQERGHRTFKWDVRAIDGGHHLGIVKWFPRWRRYVFEPVNGCVFDVGCLARIGTFIQEQMEKRRG